GGGRCASGSQVIRAIRTPGRRAAASTNRVVVSSRYGATNPAVTMGETYPPVTMPDMNVVFVEPFFPSNQRQFARALAEAGATVIGIGEYGVESFDDDLKGWLHHYERVPSVTDEQAWTRAVRAGRLRGRGGWDRRGVRRAGRGVDGGGGVRRGTRGVLRHDRRGRPGGPGLRLALLPERARGDAHPVDLAAVRLHQPGGYRAG